MKGTLFTHTEVLTRPNAMIGYTFHPRVTVSQSVDTEDNSSPETSVQDIVVASTEYGEPLMIIRTWTEWYPLVTFTNYGKWHSTAQAA